MGFVIHIYIEKMNEWLNQVLRTQYIFGIHNITSVIDIRESLVDDTLLSTTYCGPYDITKNGSF